jgi:dipeptidyl aminopeptidase/acylaminoacyl peptidase
MKRLLLLVSLVACGGGSKQGPQPTGPTDPGSTEAKPADPKPETAAPVAVGHPRNDLIPRATLFGNPERVSPRLSSDGKQLAWLAPKDGVMNVWVAPVDKLDQGKAVTAETTRPIRQFFWTFTNKHLLYMQDSGGDENFHVFRVDLADGKTTDITPYKGARAAVEEISDKQPTTLLITMNDRDAHVFDLYKVDLLTAKRTLLAQNDDNFAGFQVDNDMNVRFAQKSMPDGSMQIMAPDPKKPGAWVAYDSVPFEDALTTQLVAFSPNNKSFYMNDSRNRDTAALVQVDIATKKQTVIAEDAKSDSQDVIVQPKTHTLQAVAFNYDKLRWKVLDKSIQKDLDALDKLDGGEVHISSRTLDDKWWVVATTSEQHPSNFYLWDRAKQKGTFLFSARPELDKQPLVKMSPVEIKARDGLTLMSYLTVPASAKGPAPMVLLVHGGPWARDGWGYNPLHQLLANRGYAVLSVNYRGSTGFGKKFLNASNLQWSKAMHDDLLDAVKWAVDSSITTKDNVCIMGGSYGGYATLVGLAMTPDEFKCGVDIVGPSNLATLLASIPPYWAPLVATFHQRVGNPETAEGKAILEAASPLTHVAKIKRPLMIGQGANDPRVKQAESEQIVAAMKKAKLPVTYILFPDEGHGFARPVNNIAFFGAAEAFLSAHLGGSYLPLTKAEVEASTMQVKEGKAGIPGLP